MPESIGFLYFQGQRNLAHVGKDGLYLLPMDIKEWVRAARKHKTLTQTGLGELVGVGKQNVSSWETGKHSPSYQQLVKIAHETGYPLATHDVANLEWPFSRELLKAIQERIRSSPEDRLWLENTLRTALKMSPLAAEVEARKPRAA